LRTRQHLALPDEIDDLVQAVYEEQVEMPESLQQRLEEALVSEEGESFARKVQANRAIIGLPDDASWNDPSMYIKADEDEPGLHPALVAQTRLGEPSVLAIPMFPADGFRPEVEQNLAQSKSWFLRAMSLSRKGVVRTLQTQGVPQGWDKSPLLRNCYPLLLDQQGRWTQDEAVRLDNDLGLLYEPKDVE
jgi:CRISPR-associated endonuclease/helicase Cas3